MANFLGYFPRVAYDITREGLSNYELITNITFRIGILRDILTNVSAYFFYTIKDGETPEILAENFYGDPQSYWIIFYANDIYDPQYDWPLTTNAFRKFLVNKYRQQAAVSLGLAANTITDTQIISWTQDTTNANSVHHYEKQIIRFNATDNTTLTINLEVNGTNVASALNSTLANTPYDFYTSANTSDPRALEYAGSYETFDIGGKTIQQTIRGAAITYYDYENDLNESKREIRVIKAQYYNQIMEEFKSLTNSSSESYIRRLI